MSYVKLDHRPAVPGRNCITDQSVFFTYENMMLEDVHPLYRPSVKVQREYILSDMWRTSFGLGGFKASSIAITDVILEKLTRGEGS